MAKGLQSSYIISARRSALGRPGGLHGNRRLEALAQPVIEATLSDAGIEAKRVDELVLGNVSGDGNPARLIGLASGLPETSTAYTIDRQCASGLDAVLFGIRSVSVGEADVVVAGGASSLSTAPWRVAKPRNIFQLPRFLSPADGIADGGDDQVHIEAMERLIKSHSIQRSDLDCYALESITKARAAYDQRQFVGEIIPIRVEPGEAIDERLDGDTSIDAMEDMEALLETGGTITQGNAAALSDGAAFVVIVSAKVYEELGRPPGLKLVASARTGANMVDPGEALVKSLERLLEKTGDIFPDKVGVFEINEATAGEILLTRDKLNIPIDRINPCGGAIARGHAPGASGAVLLARLFSSMVRMREDRRVEYGVAALGARGGQGIAALFEAC